MQLIHIVINISKAIIILIVALLVLSFSSVISEEEKKDWKKINNSLDEIYGNADYTFTLFEVNQRNKFSKYYRVKKNNIIIAYLMTDRAPSKFHLFNYFVLYNIKSEIEKVRILNYRENYGGEICSKNWLKQFKNNNATSSLDFNNKIDAISGATISVNSLKNSVWFNTKSLKGFLGL